MLRNSIFSVFSLLLFSHCMQEKCDIRVVCEAAPTGCYKIKWETFPPMVGTVKIYESSIPDSFNLYSPIAESEINASFKDVFFARTTKRSYFKLVFNKKYSIITAERTIPMQGLFNLRDLGGYYNTTGKQTRWGKLYRSSALANATSQDTQVLNNLGIRTVIDFRTNKERHDAPLKYSAPQVINLPLRGNPFNAFFSTILSGEMKTGDVKVYLQGNFAFLLENNSDFFIKMFNILLDANSYPVLIDCSPVSDRSAVASALILAALDIDLDQIIYDYMLTNEQMDLKPFIPDTNIFLKEQDVQETFTALFRVHKGTITYSFDKILKEYGTLDDYFNTELNLTAKKREKLKEIMLY